MAPPRGLLLALGVLLGPVMGLGAQTPPLPEPAPGAVIARLQCVDDARQSYALVLPPNYTADRAWPIVYCFDAGAQGRRPVERLREAAELYGYIVVGSNNSHNGPYADMVAAANAVWRDTHQRFRLDHRRCYAAGCSGGARAACLVATLGKLAGVIACSGGFPQSTVPKQVTFAFFGTAGREDFNYREMKQVEAALAAQHSPHHLAIFDGGHEWLPAPLAVEALEWLELQAMRSGRRPRDDALIGTLFRKRLQTVAAARDAGEAYVGYLAVAADFDGLTDTSGPAAKAADLKDSKAVREYFRAERKAEQQEQRGLDRLYEAAEAAHAWTPWNQRQVTGMLQGLSQTDYSASESAHATEAGLGGESRPDGWSRPDLGHDEDLLHDADRYAAMRDAVADLGRQSKTSVAARRALNGAFAVIFERGRALLEDKDYAAAVECFELTAIIRPEAPMNYVALTRAHTLHGDRREARAALQLAIAKGFNDPKQISQLQEALAH
jgi:tetratricopeptide (TPR) repeat protein